MQVTSCNALAKAAEVGRLQRTCRWLLIWMRALLVLTRRQAPSGARGATGE
jgi:hypothetical protein